VGPCRTILRSCDLAILRSCDLAILACDNFQYGFKGTPSARHPLDPSGEARARPGQPGGQTRARQAVRGDQADDTGGRRVLRAAASAASLARKRTSRRAASATAPPDPAITSQPPQRARNGQDRAGGSRGGCRFCLRQLHVSRLRPSAGTAPGGRPRRPAQSSFQRPRLTTLVNEAQCQTYGGWYSERIGFSGRQRVFRRNKYDSY
jgi:hypothetical protein